MDNWSLVIVIDGYTFVWAMPSKEAAYAFWRMVRKPCLLVRGGVIMASRMTTKRHVISRHMLAIARSMPRLFYSRSIAPYQIMRAVIIGNIVKLEETN